MTSDAVLVGDYTWVLRFIPPFSQMYVAENENMLNAIPPPPPEANVNITTTTTYSMCLRHEQSFLHKLWGESDNTRTGQIQKTPLTT